MEEKGNMGDEQEKKYLLMTEAPLEKLVLKLAGPAIITMLVTSFYNMTDTYFVGNLGTSASGAIGISMSLMTLIQACGHFFGQGSGNYIARALGTKDVEKAERMAITALSASVICSLGILLVGLINLEQLARWLGSTDTILPYAKDYIRFILVGAPFKMGSIVLSVQLRFQGNSFIGMIGLVSGAVLNIALDPLLIYAFNIGISGASIATAIGQGASFFLLLIYMQRSNGIRLSICKTTFKIHYLKNIVLGGAPSLVRQGIGSAATICLNLVAKGYGDAAVAAMGIVDRMAHFVNSVLLGFSQGYQPVCGFNFGAKRFDRVQKGFYTAVKMGTVCLTALSFICIITAPNIVSLFRNDQEVIAIGAAALAYQCYSLPFNAWSSFSDMCLQSVGKTKGSIVIALSRRGLFFIPLIFVLTHFWGVLGMQLARPVANMMGFIIAVPLQLRFFTELRKMETFCQSCSPISQ
ncbi:MAG: MATE family efflux transporter [Puniceicoccales bacterium]|jgi:putative MATE family efflux protein|nr:MATE family efflux transporter [Puniceicoccales bacterium]